MCRHFSRQSRHKWLIVSVWEWNEFSSFRKISRHFPICICGLEECEVSRGIHCEQQLWYFVYNARFPLIIRDVEVWTRSKLASRRTLQTPLSRRLSMGYKIIYDAFYAKQWVRYASVNTHVKTCVSVDTCALRRYEQFRPRVNEIFFTGTKSNIPMFFFQSRSVYRGTFE